MNFKLLEFYCPTCRENRIHILRPKKSNIKSLAECTVCFTKAGMKQNLATPDKGKNLNKILIQS